MASWTLTDEPQHSVKHVRAPPLTEDQQLSASDLVMALEICNRIIIEFLFLTAIYVCICVGYTTYMKTINTDIHTPLDGLPEAQRSVNNLVFILRV